MRTLALPKPAEPWSLTGLRDKLIKIGAKVVSHGRYMTFQIAGVAVSRQMFAEVLSLIARLRAPPRRHEGPGRANVAGDEGRGVSRCRQGGACQRFGAVNRWLRSTLARDEGNMPLPKPVKRAILTS
jgi:hypothetical protein